MIHRELPPRERRSREPSQPSSADAGIRWCWCCTVLQRMDGGATDHPRIVRARAENKRVTGGSRRAIFGIPTRATWHASFRRALFAWRLFRSPLRYSSHAAPIARVLVSAPPSSITRFFFAVKTLRFAFLSLFLSFSLPVHLSVFCALPRDSAMRYKLSLAIGERRAGIADRR